MPAWYCRTAIQAVMQYESYADVAVAGAHEAKQRVPGIHLRRCNRWRKGALLP